MLKVHHSLVKFIMILDDTTKLTVGLRYDENDNYFQLMNTLGDASASGAIAAQCAKANGGVLVRNLKLWICWW